MHRIRAYRALAGLSVQRLLAYRAHFWVALASRVLTLVVLVAFWRAIGEADAVTTAEREASLRYLVVAQMVAPLAISMLIPMFGSAVLDGSIAVELLRPLDVQECFYAQSLGTLVAGQLREMLVLGVVGVLWLDLVLPTDPRIYLAFLVTVLLGHAIMFLVDWGFAMLSFVTTATWGLSSMRHVLALFFGGALVPPQFAPPWLKTMAAALPFAEVVAAPAGVLLGTVPLAALPRLWLGQLAWLVGLGIASRVVYRLAIRRVTVAGG
ncbi:MAG TPA: ABC-2 family transporter protein [Polyangia bacterium]|jgi:ABC-2 type transport system permease protein|nr:ABC-2 family transporter protein [Polyangia bacterium]